MESNTTLSEGSRPVSRIDGATNDDLARIAYVCMEELPFLEMNDGNRLGYHIYLYLHGEIPSIADAIYEAKARLPVAPSDLERIIAQRLYAAGVRLE
jgi:hypothetical protein